MKIRTDFVTNSSSSSFILARNPKLSEKQKEEIIKYVEDTLLGRAILTPQSSEEEIERVFEEEWSLDEEKEEEIKKALKEGKTIYSGFVNFEESEYNYSDLFESLWDTLEKAEEGSFVAIEGDLSY